MLPKINLIPTNRWAACLRFATLTCTLSALLLACSDKPSPIDFSPQTWQDLTIRVESHPSPVALGFNEFWVFITDPKGHPVWDCQVALHSDPTTPWSQAIQDGRMGVYRRASQVKHLDDFILEVEIKQQEKSTILHFPLTPSNR